MTTPLDLNDPIAVLLASLQALRSVGLQAATYGGLALATYGAPRETKDADLAIGAVDLRTALSALRASELDAKLTFERVRFGGNLVSRFTLLPLESQTGLNTLDLIEPRSARFAADVLQHSMEGTMRGQVMRVVSPEDFVLLKVLSTRDRDIEDAASVVATLGARLDVSAIRSEADRLAIEISDHDVASRLGRALSRP